ncbi:PDZ domain-containing protein [Schlesneria paludicola]|uniref:PDZ domain-containing protein n=1 Tax=Schlesneria paludicola TaxID=360056 RepID=UPI00029B54D0|nr:PDZ domain-containing protein [Schlesneria paludicola]
MRLAHLFVPILLVTSVLTVTGSHAAEDMLALDTPFIGAKVEPLADAVFEAKERTKESLPKFGLVVRCIDAGGPAAVGGLKKLDILNSINSKPVKSIDELRAVMDKLPKGTPWTIVYHRLSSPKGDVATWKRETATLTATTARQYLAESMKSTHDEASGATFIEYSHSPELGEGTTVVPYIVKAKDGTVAMRMRIQYSARDWMFIQKFVIKVDRDDSDYFDANDEHKVERGHAAGMIWEWMDYPVTSGPTDLLRRIVKSKKAVLRYEGKQTKQERELDDDDRRRIMFVLMARDLIKA